MFERKYEKEKIKNSLNEILLNMNDNTKPKCIYIYGNYGVGKTTLVKDILKEMNIDMIYYNACNIRNKSLIESFSKMSVSTTNVLSIFKKEKKNIVVVLDEIDNLNNGDKCGINQLIKLVRPKKTKKQKEEMITNIPIICIGNHKIDKKIKELISITKSFEIIKEIYDCESMCKSNKMNNYINGDIRKYETLKQLSKTIDITDEVMDCIIQTNSFEETKDNVKKLLIEKQDINYHSFFIHEQDRTITSMILHENIIDYMNEKNIVVYKEMLKLICLSDYIDRITFQKQIWNMNELSSMIKTFNVHYLFHEINKNKIKSIRFTKILTKYSNEYNNFIFISKILKQVDIDKYDFLQYIYELYISYGEEYVYNDLSKYNLSSLERRRIIRYIIFFE